MQGICLEANFGQEPYHFNMDDLLVEEEIRHNPGNVEPWRFKEKVGPCISHRPQTVQSPNRLVRSLSLSVSHHSRCNR